MTWKISEVFVMATFSSWPEPFKISPLSDLYFWIYFCIRQQRRTFMWAIVLTRLEQLKTRLVWGQGALTRFEQQILIAFGLRTRKDGTNPCEPLYWFASCVVFGWGGTNVPFFCVVQGMVRERNRYILKWDLHVNLMTIFFFLPLLWLHLGICFRLRSVLPSIALALAPPACLGPIRVSYKPYFFN
jgi:hypothetical protein